MEINTDLEATMIASFATPAGTAYIDMNGARETIWNYLYGKQSFRLSVEDWFEVYAQADGFGDCSRGEERAWLAEYVSQGSDWSHVRDSSPEAMSRVMAEIIKRQK